MNKQEYQTLLAQCAASMSGNILFPRINEIDMKEVASDAVCAAKALLKEVGIEEEEEESDVHSDECPCFDCCCS